MDKAYSIFLSLVKSELWQTPLDLSLSHSEFTVIYNIASKQAMLGILAASLIRNDVQLERQDVLKILTIQSTIAKSNRALNAELERLHCLLDKNKIDAIVVKGQTIGIYYPDPFSRTPGDIDFYCDKKNLAKVIPAIAHDWGININVEPTDQHFEIDHNSITLELHHCLMRFASHKSQKIWNRIFENLKPSFVNVNGSSIQTLEPTLNLLYTFLHLYHHLIELGVGLRQFCDVAILLKVYHDVIDKEQLYKWLDELDFRKAFDAIQLILVKLLGLDEKFALCPIPINESSDTISLFMDIVWFGGNFGFHGYNRSFRFKSQYFLVTTYRKLQLYYRFYRFSPREIRASVLSAIPHKAMLAFKGRLQKPFS